MSGTDENLAEDASVDDDQDVDAVVERFTVRRRLAGRRLDKYICTRNSRISRTTAQRLIRSGAVTVNGMPAKPSYEPAAGDVIEMVLPPPQPTKIIPEDIPLNIIFEDDHLLVLNKPPLHQRQPQYRPRQQRQPLRRPLHRHLHQQPPHRLTLLGVSKPGGAPPGGYYCPAPFSLWGR